MIDVIKKFPCNACGGKLRHNVGTQCVCEKCDTVCSRSPCLEDETITQEELLRRTNLFKNILRKTMEMSDRIIIQNIERNDDLSIVNGKPLRFFARYKYPCAIAVQYENFYYHESMANGACEWDRSLRNAVNVCNNLGIITWEQSERLIREIEKLPIKEQFVNNE